MLENEAERMRGTRLESVSIAMDQFIVLLPIVWNSFAFSSFGAAFHGPRIITSRSNQ